MNLSPEITIVSGGKSTLISLNYAPSFWGVLYSCRIDNGKPPIKRDFELNDSSILRVRGLNSVIISSHRDCEKRLMVLGEYQICPREEGVTELSLCHHPPDCWRDNDITKSKLRGRYRVQLYGHKHIQTAMKVDNTLVICAGAAHPSRTEKIWIPRYNWLSMSVSKNDGKRFLNVKIYPRVLDPANDHFIPDTNSCDRQIFKSYDLLLEDWDKSQSTKELPDKKSLTESTPQILMEIEQTDNTSDNNSIKNPFRILVYRFLGLSYTSRELILSELGLNSDDDDGVEHIKLIEKILERAKAKDILANFWDKVEDAHNGSRYKENPFRVNNS